MSVSVAPERWLGPACPVCPCQYQLGPACPCPYLPTAGELPNTHTPNCHSSSHTFYTTHPYLAHFQLKLSFPKLCLTDPYGSQSPQVVICTFSSRNGLLLPIECEDHLLGTIAYKCTSQCTLAQCMHSVQLGDGSSFAREKKPMSQKSGRGKICLAKICERWWV